MEKLIHLTVGLFLFYAFGWFISGQSNAMLWPWYGKLTYVIIIIILIDYQPNENTPQ
jgi:hypothetical protein